MMFAEPSTWHSLMEVLTDLTIDFLRAQLDAGVDAIQLFDSWAGTLSLADYRTYVLPHSCRVFAELAGRGPDDPLRGRYRGVARRHGEAGQPWSASTGAPRWPTRPSGSDQGKALQGNLDPVVLLAGWPAVETAARAVVEDARRAMAAGAAGHIFNLGHGVLPATDPQLITDLVALVHSL